MQSIDNVLMLRKGLKPNDPNPDIFDILWAKKLSDVGRFMTIIGNPLSFLTKKAQLAKSTKITMNPIQNLNGYEYPWPAGGGKNKVDNSQNIVGGYWYWNAQLQTAVWTEREDMASSNLIPVKGNMTYMPSLYRKNGMRIGNAVVTLWGDENTCTGQYTNSNQPFTTNADTAFVALRNFANQSEYITDDDFLFQLEEGSTATSYVPYSNVCPISGRTSVSLGGCSINMLPNGTSADKGYASGKYLLATGAEQPSTAYYISEYFNVKPNTVYTYKKYSLPIPNNVSVCFYDKEKNYISGENFNYRESFQIITPANAVFARASQYIENQAFLFCTGINPPASYVGYQQSNEIAITFPALGNNVAKFVAGKGIGQDGSITNEANRSATVEPILIDKAKNYYVNGISGTSFIYAVWTNNGQLVRRESGVSRGSLLTTNDGDYMYVCAYRANYSVTPDEYELIVSVDSVKAYEPYTNTVYGGTLDVETGTLSVDKKAVQIKDIGLVYQTSAGGVFRTNHLDDIKDGTKNLISSILKVTNVGVSRMLNWTMRTGDEAYSDILYIKAIDYTDVSTLIGAVGNEYIVYPLATPRTISLTPEEVQLLKGVNNIWTDGDQIELTYKF